MGKQRIQYVIGQFAFDPGEEESDERRWIILSPLMPERVPTLPFPVAVKLGKSDSGRLVCVGLRLGADAIPGYTPLAAGVQITSHALREIPLRQILDDVAEMIARPLPFLLAAEMAERLDAATVEYDKPRKHPGRRGHPLAFYEGIRDLYREALQVSPGHVSRYIVEHAKDADGRPMYVETDREDLRESREATARRWVMKVRKKGLLGPAQRGMAGERRVATLDMRAAAPSVAIVANNDPPKDPPAD